MILLSLCASISLFATHAMASQFPLESNALLLRTQYKATTPVISNVEVAPNWTIYVEESGNPNGIPVVFFHGGPGIKFRATDHQWFNPEKYRIIVFQQRGTSNCTPSAMDLNT
ncbi:MAG: hypothetical protein V4489_00880, partial [Chlamydiota bacterium]